MRVMMTGATGLIGKEVGKMLVEKGHELVVVSRDPERARRDLPFPATLFKWEGTTGEFPHEALHEVRGVIHLAGEPIAEKRWTAARKKKIRDSRVLGSRSLIDAILANAEAAWKIRTFIQGSAIGYYGDRGDEPLNEDSPLGQGFLAEVVRDWEAEVDRFAEKSTQLRVVKLRTGIVLARHGGALERLLPIFSKGLGGKLGKGQQWMSWIHLQDIARLIVFCLENEQISGVVNATAPEPARNDRFTVTLARSLDRPVSLPVPETALKVALGEMSEALLGSQRVLPQKAKELGFHFQFPELTHALGEITEPLRHGQHELLAEQWVPKAPHEVFPFFCSETNLEELTPKFLGFRVIGKSTENIGEGTLIDYRLSLRGLPLKWRTRIESWKPNESFVDTQLRGPYRRWHHTHEFVPFAGGTLMRDRVLYQLPLGFLGDTVAGWKVGSDVAKIFAFRRQKVDELFGKQK